MISEIHAASSSHQDHEAASEQMEPRSQEASESTHQVTEVSESSDIDMQA